MERWRKLAVVGVTIFAVLFFAPVVKIADGRYQETFPSYGCGIGTIPCPPFTPVYGTHYMFGSVIYWAVRVGAFFANGTYSIACG